MRRRDARLSLDPRRSPCPRRRCPRWGCARCTLSRAHTGAPQKLVVLAAEIGGRWSDECHQFLRQLRLRAQRTPAPLRASATQDGWGVLSVALQRAVASSVLGIWTMPPLPGEPDDVPLGDVLDLAEAAAPSQGFA